MDPAPQTRIRRPDRDTKLGRKWLLWVFPIVILIGAARYFNVQVWLRAALDWLNGLGPWGPVIFIALYILACVCFVPASILTLGAGASFGIVRGVVYVMIGATLGATCAFLVGRYLARDWVTRKIAGNDRFAAIDEAVARDGWKIVLLTRLSPLFPFSLLNYAFGVTRVQFKDYVSASVIGMLPATMFYVYLGSIAGTLAGPGGNRRRTPADWAFCGLGLLATIAVALVVTRMARKALAQRITA